MKIIFLLFYITIAPLTYGVELTLENIYKNDTFHTKEMGKWKWIPKSNDILIYDKAHGDSLKSFHRVEIGTKDTTTFIPSEKLVFMDDTFNVSSFSFDKTGTKLLLLINRSNIWRHSYSGNYFVYDLFSEDFIQVSDKDSQLKNVKFSPDGRKISYVKDDNNLYVFDFLSQWEKQLTWDGSETILNGHFGWLYEEEFSGYDAYRWSPDSKYIFFFREDQSNVKQFHWLDEQEQYPRINTVYYPKVGEDNPVMKLGIVNVRNRRIKWFYNEPEEDFYFPRAVWQNDKIIVFRLNRKQNQLDLVRFDPRYRRGEILLTERDSCWIDIHDNIRILKDGSFIWTSERSGYNHIYHYDRNGTIINQLTHGDWEVRKIIDINEETNIIYFTATKVSELENHLFSISLYNGNLIQITQESGWHSVAISPTKSRIIDSWSNIMTPTTHLVKNIDGKNISTISKPDKSKFDKLYWTYPDFIKVQTSDGVFLNAIITLPWNFDKSKSYPILLYAYGLSGSQTVTNRWSGRNYLWHQYMAKNGFIIFSIDNRQTGGRGKAFKNLGYGDYGKYLIRDQIEGINYLGSLPYADTSKVGIWGWSGGGYATALALTKGAEYFDVGVAVASVTDWRLYDTAYTERYMGLLSENEAGYDSASVFSYIDRFKGNLLLIHGTGDDNVHSQHSIQLVNKFIKEGKLIDTMFYPSRNHGIYGGNASFHLRKLMTNYFLEYLSN
jgi:dipeptidyl-peptidase-4